MKIRRVKTSLLVLIGLIVLSLTFYVSAEEKSFATDNIFLDSDQDGLSDAEEKSLGTDPDNSDTDRDGYSDGVEVNSGYNPLQPAPGDKLITETEKTIAPIAASSADNKNLTQVLSQKITELATESSNQGETISQNEVQALVDESILINTNKEIILPELKREDLNIQKQNYGKYSEEKAEEKRKDDVSNYLVTIIYIFSNNSPRPITSDTSLGSVFSSLSQEIIQAITLRNSSSLKNLNENGEKIQEQLLQMEVPEEMADTHIKIIQFVRYSQEAEKFINPNSEDPVMDMTNLSYLYGLVTEMISFTEELKNKFSAYDINLDEKLQKKMEDLGLEIPTDIQDVLQP